MYAIKVAKYVFTEAFPISTLKVIRAYLKSVKGTGALLKPYAQEIPEKIAITYKGKHITWKQFERDSIGIAAALHKMGVGKGDKVGVCMKNRPEFIIANTAFSYIGAYTVPINSHYSEREISYILKDSKVSIVFCDEETADKVKGAKVITLEEFDRLKESPPIELSPKPSGAVLYTSGTTGEPKGAVRDIERIAKVMLMMIYEFGISYRDAHLVVAPLYHAAPAALATLHMLVGARLVLDDKFDPEMFLKTVEEEGVTDVFVVPTMLSDILALQKKPELPTLTKVICAAAPLKVSTKMNFINRFGKRLWEFYGSTETGVVTILKPSDYHRLDSVGKPTPWCKVGIFSDDGKKLKTGETGEICVKTKALMSEYLGRSTKDDFFGDFFRTGDTGYMDEKGYLYITGREKDMIISGGVNIYPAEIEKAIEEHPYVEEASVIGRPDERMGEVPFAFIVTKKPLGEKEILKFLEGKLAKIKIPKGIKFVESLPKNPQGKVLKRVLKDMSKFS